MHESREKFVLCADDFAITEAVSRAMLRLVDAGRLTAVSAMASMPAWSELAPELRARRNRVAIGLHLDLTSFAGKGQSFDLRQLIKQSLFGRINLRAISAEFERQFDLFETALGVLPDHVDGHHHVHALPQMRVALLTVLNRRYGRLPPDLRPLVRNPADSILRILRRRAARGKALALAGFCAGFGAHMTAGGFATNLGFSGFSQFRGRQQFDSEFQEFLIAPGPRHLVMCHPGIADDRLAALDSVSDQRNDEYALLMNSEALLRDMLHIDRHSDQAGSALAAWSAL